MGERINLDDGWMVCNGRGSAKKNSGVKNWKKYWEKHSAECFPKTCTIRGCNKDARVGAHVFLQNISKGTDIMDLLVRKDHCKQGSEIIFIIPMCFAHNSNPLMDEGAGYAFTKDQTVAVSYKPEVKLGRTTVIFRFPDLSSRELEEHDEDGQCAFACCDEETKRFRIPGERVHPLVEHDHTLAPSEMVVLCCKHHKNKLLECARWLSLDAMYILTRDISPEFFYTPDDKNISSTPIPLALVRQSLHAAIKQNPKYQMNIGVKELLKNVVRSYTELYEVHKLGEICVDREDLITYPENSGPELVRNFEQNPKYKTEIGVCIFLKNEVRSYRELYEVLKLNEYDMTQAVFRTYLRQRGPHFLRRWQKWRASILHAVEKFESDYKETTVSVASDSSNTMLERFNSHDSGLGGIDDVYDDMHSDRDIQHRAEVKYRVGKGVKYHRKKNENSGKMKCGRAVSSKTIAINSAELGNFAPCKNCYK